MRRNLAFYKLSGKPWTYQEYLNVLNYVGDSPPPDYIKNNELKFIFDDNSNYCFMHNWEEQDRNQNFSNCRQIAYESVFGKLIRKRKLK